MIQNLLRRRGLYLGIVPETAAAKDSSTLFTLDHDLGVLPAEGRRLTVAEIAGHVDDLASRLAAAGVRAAERIVIYKAPNFDVWLLATAAARIGAVPVMLSPALGSETVAALLKRLEQPHLLSDDHKLDELADVSLADLTRLVISVSGPRPGVVALGGLAGAPRVKPVFQGLDDPAMITHTSGTTGLPKLVVHTPRTMRSRLRPQVYLLSLIRKRETVAIHVSFVHSRMFAAVSLCLQKGLPMLLMNESDPDLVADFFVRNRPGLIEALPNSYMSWEGLTEDARKPFASVKYFSSTFDAIHPRTMRRLLDSSERPSPLFFQIYGQSEVGPAVGRPYTRGSVGRMDGRCVGYPMPGCARVRVASQDGRRPDKRNPGFIEARWDGIAKGYFGEDERYAANLHDNWWRTGDVGYRSKFGCLHMLDREADTIPGVDSNLDIEDRVLNRLYELSELVVVRGPAAEAIPVVCTSRDKPLDMNRWRAAVADFPQLADPIQIPLAELPRTATLKTRRIELSRLINEQISDHTD
jgi:acyl-coenzyme A synthetase/AMP-(fatty) acid ligase